MFQTTEQGEDGKPLIASQFFTLSMHEKASLRKFLEAWRGKAYTEEQAREGVDVELMVDVPALIQVTHNHKNGRPTTTSRRS